MTTSAAARPADDHRVEAEPDSTRYRTGLSSKLGPEAAAIPMRPYPPHAVPDGAKPYVAPPEHFPRLSLTERDRRWDGLRKRMIFAGIDVLVILGNDIYWDQGLANLRYITGTGAKMGSVGLFFMQDDPVVYNAVPHMSQPFHAQESLQDWVSDIRILRGINEIAAELRDRGLGKARVGLVGFSSAILPSSVFVQSEVKALEAALPTAQFVDFGYALLEMRLVKSEEEIALMRRGGEVARKVVDAMASMARPGVSEAELYAEMIRTQIANGAEPLIFNLMTSGPVEHPTSELWHLLHGMDQPASPTTRPLSEGDLVIAEYHTKFGGYLVHTEYTAHVGNRIPSQLQRLWDVAVECLDASQQILRPGVTVREALEAIRKPAEAAGFNWVELGFHAMGLASPEFPSAVYRPGYGLPTGNAQGIGDLVLEENMTFGNNIDLHDPGWKTDVGVVLSDFMVVKEGGAELLVDTPRTIGIAD